MRKSRPIRLCNADQLGLIEHSPECPSSTPNRGPFWGLTQSRCMCRLTSPDFERNQGDGTKISVNEAGAGGPSRRTPVAACRSQAEEAKLFNVIAGKVFVLFEQVPAQRSVICAAIRRSMPKNAIVWKTRHGTVVTTARAARAHPGSGPAEPCGESTARGENRAARARGAADGG